MAIRKTTLNKYGFFGTFGRIVAEYIITPLAFYGLSYGFLYIAGGFVLPSWWVPLGTLFIGVLGYRSFVGIHRQFFTRR